VHAPIITHATPLRLVRREEIQMLLENFVIDSKKPTHLAWWADYFGVSEEVLLAAIAATGERAGAVRTYFEEQQRHQAAQSSS
jgi:predicted 3-demethylubiquinone-9 3-methyltransferase (glyoxalase superfamily)